MSFPYQNFFRDILFSRAAFNWCRQWPLLAAPPAVSRTPWAAWTSSMALYVLLLRGSRTSLGHPSQKLGLTNSYFPFTLGGCPPWLLPENWPSWLLNSKRVRFCLPQCLAWCCITLCVLNEWKNREGSSYILSTDCVPDAISALSH